MVTFLIIFICLLGLCILLIFKLKQKRKFAIFLMIFFLLGLSPILLSDGISKYATDKSEEIFAQEMLSVAKHELSTFDALHFPPGLQLRISKLQSSKGACVVKHYYDINNTLNNTVCIRTTIIHR